MSAFAAHPDPSIDSVWAWFPFQTVLLNDANARAVRYLEFGIEPERTASPAIYSRFFGLTRDEIDDFFKMQRGQLELLTMFELLATTEAIVRAEYRLRSIEKRKDSLSRRFRQLYQAHGEHVRLDEDILEALGQEGIQRSVVSAFRGSLSLRHWLAHGRY